MTRALVVGLTGGIGSGKSAVASAFAQIGVPVVDTDAIAHQLSAAGMPGQRAVAEAFGSDAVAADGSLDRAWLRRRAFADSAFRRELERRLHPLIRDEADRAIAVWQADYGVLVVPLLFERGGARGRVDRVLAVDCPEDVQVARVMARSGLSEPDVRAIMAAQLSRSARLAMADDVIDNGGSLAALAPQVARLDALYRSESRTRLPDRAE
ncbi:MAG TPA: dephospho-CoA kinase [Casimicrobiaceae bacterium]|nr:dephospho-CoA kinase [Casimicrobiaceae bacterium]